MQCEVTAPSHFLDRLLQLYTVFLSFAQATSQKKIIVVRKLRWKEKPCLHPFGQGTLDQGQRMGCFIDVIHHLLKLQTTALFKEYCAHVQLSKYSYALIAHYISKYPFLVSMALAMAVAIHGVVYAFLIFCKLF